MKDFNKQLMKEAINMAVENIKNGGGPFAALIVKDNKIIGRGVNQVTMKNDPTAHAEIQAIRDACKNADDFQLAGCEVYTTCEPCPMCLGAIYWARPDKVYYASTKTDAAKAGFDDAFIYKEIDIEGEKRSIPAINTLRQDAEVIFDEWEKTNTKIEY